MQKVVRTYPQGWARTTEALSDLLSEGYNVVMCHEIPCDKSQMCLEYIVEKKD